MNRRTMLAPMRPRPIMPTCIAPPLAPQPLVEAPWTPRLLLHGNRALPYLRRPPASIAVSPAAQVQPRRADRQAVERDLREPARQLRVDVEPAPRRVGAEAVRLPQPRHMSGSQKRFTPRAARSALAIPLHRQWPALEAIVRTGCFSGSSVNA